MLSLLSFRTKELFIIELYTDNVMKSRFLVILMSSDGNITLALLSETQNKIMLLSLTVLVF